MRLHLMVAMEWWRTLMTAIFRASKSIGRLTKTYVYVFNAARSCSELDNLHRKPSMCFERTFSISI